jgi:hypothetical protein
MANPVYSVNDVVYVRESAALGFLEAVKISGVMQYNGYWVYTISAVVGQPQAPSVYGDRISLVSGNTLYFREDEFVDECSALALAEARAQSVLDSIQSKRSSKCT